MLKSGGVRHWITEMEVPYVVRGDQWVGYDDEQSLRYKVTLPSLPLISRLCEFVIFPKEMKHPHIF